MINFPWAVRFIGTPNNRGSNSLILCGQVIYVLSTRTLTFSGHYLHPKIAFAYYICSPETQRQFYRTLHFSPIQLYSRCSVCIPTTKIGHITRIIYTDCWVTESTTDIINGVLLTPKDSRRDNLDQILRSFLGVPFPWKQMHASPSVCTGSKSESEESTTRTTGSTGRGEYKLEKSAQETEEEGKGSRREGSTSKKALIPKKFFKKEGDQYFPSFASLATQTLSPFDQGVLSIQKSERTTSTFRCLNSSSPGRIWLLWALTAWEFWKKQSPDGSEYVSTQKKCSLEPYSFVLIGFRALLDCQGHIE